MWCAFCGRPQEQCPGGIWRGARKGAEGLCVYCARVALRALDPTGQAPGVAVFRPRPEPPRAA